MFEIIKGKLKSIIDIKEKCITTILISFYCLPEWKSLNNMMK